MIPYNMVKVTCCYVVEEFDCVWLHWTMKEAGGTFKVALQCNFILF